MPQRVARHGQSRVSKATVTGQRSQQVSRGNKSRFGDGRSREKIQLFLYSPASNVRAEIPVDLATCRCHSGQRKLVDFPRNLPPGSATSSTSALDRGQSLVVRRRKILNLRLPLGIDVLRLFPVSAYFIILDKKTSPEYSTNPQFYCFMFNL